MVSIFRAVAVNNSLMTGTGSVCGASWEVMRGGGGGDREFLTPCSTQYMQAFLLPDQLAITRPSGTVSNQMKRVLNNQCGKLIKNNYLAKIKKKTIKKKIAKETSFSKQLGP
jgi:hypothetical protein